MDDAGDDGCQDIITIDFLPISPAKNRKNAKSAITSTTTTSDTIPTTTSFTTATASVSSSTTTTAAPSSVASDATTWHLPSQHHVQSASGFNRRNISYVALCTSHIPLPTNPIAWSSTPSPTPHFTTIPITPTRHMTTQTTRRMTTRYISTTTTVGSCARGFKVGFAVTDCGGWQCCLFEIGNPFVVLSVSANGNALIYSSHMHAHMFFVSPAASQR